MNRQSNVIRIIEEELNNMNAYKVIHNTIMKWRKQCKQREYEFIISSDSLNTLLRINNSKYMQNISQHRDPDDCYLIRSTKQITQEGEYDYKYLYKVVFTDRVN